MAMVDSSRSERDQIATTMETLRAMRSFIQMLWDEGDIAASREGQVKEELAQVDLALEGKENDLTLADLARLEAVAITAHQLTSVLGVPNDLRALASQIEAMHQHLNASGYTEWDQLTGLQDAPR